MTICFGQSFKKRYENYKRRISNSNLRSGWLFCPLQLLEDVPQLGLVQVYFWDFHLALVWRMVHAVFHLAIRHNFSVSLYRQRIVHAAIESSVGVDQFAHLLNRDVQSSNVLLFRLNRMFVDFVDLFEHLDFLFLQFLQVVEFLFLFHCCLLCCLVVRTVQFRQPIPPVILVTILCIIAHFLYSLLFGLFLFVYGPLDLF